MVLVLDDERFDRAKALHPKWKKPSTLQNLCMDIFINRADVIISGWKKSGENIFELLPNALRNDLLSYLPSYAERKLLANELMSKEQFLELSFMLMNKKTVKLEESFFKFPLVGIRLDEFHRIIANCNLLTNSVLPSADFPNLQNLFFLGPLSMNQEMFFVKMASFTRLSKLYLDDLTSDVIFKMLELVGKQLDNLNVIFQDHNFDYYQILYLCPNLATYTQSVSWPDLETYNVDQQSEYQALVTQHNVRRLKYFTANLYKGEKVEGLFELVLFAPLIEHLTLNNLTVSRAECQSVHDVLEGHFLHLESLTLESLDLDTSCALDDFGLFVQFLVCSAPRLCLMNLSWKNDYLSNKWETQLTVAKQFLQLLEQY